MIQVSENLADKKTYNREIRALMQASTVLKPKAMKIITLHDEYMIDMDGQQIEVVPVIKWLLNA